MKGQLSLKNKQNIEVTKSENYWSTEQHLLDIDSTI